MEYRQAFWFQSLSGFQVRCNRRSAEYFESIRPVSIPIGFSSSLQLQRSNVEFTRQRVSIPIGFSSSLQPRKRSIGIQISLGFNPYRVFKFVATSNASRLSFLYSFSFNPYRVFKFVATPVQHTSFCHNGRFQSLSGFQVRCNLILWARSGRCTWFQSLSGFQVRCNCRIFGHRRRLQQGFNPYRVFKFVATPRMVSPASSM